MKKIFTIALFMLTMSLTAQNYSFFENDIRIKQGSEIVTLTHFGQFAITKNFGFTDYAQVQNGQLEDIQPLPFFMRQYNVEYETDEAYGQVLLGLYYQPITNITTSIFIGKETLFNDIRMAGYVGYTNGDKLTAYGFYQQNLNESYASEFYDVLVRFSPYSTAKNSVYLGARYMTTYGLGFPIGYRHSMSDNSNIYLSYTTYYDCTVGVDSGDAERWVPTVSLNFEFF